MEPGSRLNVLNLFNKPNKWSSEQLTGLHIEQHDDVSIANIFDDVQVDESFEALIDGFAQPTRDEIGSARVGKDVQFGQAFRIIDRAKYAFEHGFTVQKELGELADEFINISRTKYLCFSYSFSPVPFYLSSLQIRGKITHVCTYYQPFDAGLPLTIFVGRKGPEHLCSAEEIVPYLLIQAILRHERDSSLESHTVFVVSMKGTSLQFNKGVISREYLTDLISHRVPRDSFKLFRSGLYDLLEQKGRKESARGFFGLIQNVKAQFKKYEATGES